MRCWHCGKVFTPAIAGTAPMEVSCPGCGANLGMHAPVKEAPLPKPKSAPSLEMAELDPEPTPPPAPKRSAAGVMLLVGGIIFLSISGVMALESHEIATSYERTQR